LYFIISFSLCKDTISFDNTKYFEIILQKILRNQNHVYLCDVKSKNVMDFKQFKSKKLRNGIQYVNFYPNGYGVSIIQHEYSYGGNDGLWELAVLIGNYDKWDICYTSGITEDVLGYLSETEVNSICEKVSELKAI